MQTKRRAREEDFTVVVVLFTENKLHATREERRTATLLYAWGWWSSRDIYTTSCWLVASDDLVVAIDAALFSSMNSLRYHVRRRA